MFPNEGSALKLFDAIEARKQRKKPPSQRDQEIAAAVRVQGRRQVEVAAEFGLTRRRVSQICRKIEEWHGETTPWQRGEVEGPNRRRVDRVLQRSQLEEIYRSALRAFARSQEPLATVRRGKRNGQKWTDRSERQQRLDTGSRRVALRSIEMQWKLTDRPVGKDEAWDEESRRIEGLEGVVSILEFLRHDAETRGAVPKIPGGRKAAVERTLRELLGVPEEGGTGAAREGEAPAEPELQRDGVGSLWPNETLDDGHTSPAKDSRPLASTNSSMGSVWEAPREASQEALPSASVAAASRVAGPTCAAEASAASGRETAPRSAPKIEMGNASGGTSILPVSGEPSGSSATASADSSAANDRSQRPTDDAGAAQPVTANRHWQDARATSPTRLERLLASGRHMSSGHRRRLESMVVHRRGSSGSG